MASKTRALYSAFRFYVEIDSITEAAFTEVSGLDASIETKPVNSGGNNLFTYKLPLRTTWTDLTLKRGIATSTFWDWFYDCAQGTVQRRTLSVILYKTSKSGTSYPEIRWNFTDAMPIKWSGPSFNVRSEEVAFETIVLQHHGFTRVSGS